MTRRTSVMAAAMDTVQARGTAAARRTVASFLSRARWHPDPDGVVLTGNGRQALAATLAALVPPGQRLGVETLSYQSVTGIATRLGIEVVPLPMDANGLRPTASSARTAATRCARFTCSRRCIIRSA